MISERQKEYLEEVERLKNVTILPGIYTMKTNTSIQIEVLSVDQENNKVYIHNIKTGYERERTLHWCKKRLELVKANESYV